MQGTILTPTLIWKDFNTNGAIFPEILKQEILDDVVITKQYLNVANDKGEVKLFSILYQKESEKNLPVLLYVKEFNDISDKIELEFARKGYAVLSIDLGSSDDLEYKTVYPESLNNCYYNKEQFFKTEIEGEIKDSCFYQWACNVLYAINYLKGLNYSSINALAVGKASNALWQALFNQDINCAVIVNNAGWLGYKEFNKFENQVEPQFDDNKLQYIAGVDAQSYASHIKTPLFLVSATNNKDFNMEIAYDTISKISEKVYTAIDYSIGQVYNISFSCYEEIKVFIDHFALQLKDSMPGEVAIKGDIKNGKLIVEVAPDLENIKELSVYVAEEMFDSKYRTYRKVTDVDTVKNDKYYFSYTPYYESKVCFVFAKAKYKNGLSVCSNIICVRFSEDQVANSFRYKILYSSRISDCESSFAVIDEENSSPKGIDLDACSNISLKAGAMGIYGIVNAKGLRTFKIMAKKFLPDDNSMLMFDVCGKAGISIQVKLIANFFGEKQEYFASVKTLGEVWQNVKFEKQNFKTKDGFSLKTYQDINAIEIISDEEVIINNILWV